MSFKVIIHEDADGFWAKVPALPGCATQGDTYEELMQNVQDAIEGWLSVDDDDTVYPEGSRVREERVLVPV